MGTRQHGHDASPKKVATMTAKCKATTSGSMGFRLCGMKVYTTTTNTYAYRDKYFGRRIKPHEVKDAVEMFFHNGDCLQAHVIPLMLTQIYGLIGAIRHSQKYRFFSTSLLLIYEGDLKEEPRATVKLIDFARTIGKEEAVEWIQRQRLQVSGEGSIQEESGGADPTTPHDPAVQDMLAAASYGKEMEELVSSIQGESQQIPRTAQEREERFWQGPDTGLLRGLQSIAEVLEQIMVNSRKNVFEIHSRPGLGVDEPST